MRTDSVMHLRAPLALVILAMAVAGGPFVVATPITGANVDLDTVCAEPSVGQAVDKTSAASDDVPDDVPAGYDNVPSDTMNLYFGVNSKFDEIRVTVGLAGASGTLRWAYSAQSAWADLQTGHAFHDATSNFSAKGDGVVSFEPPSDWVARAIGNCNATTARFFVRASTAHAYDRGQAPALSKASARAYNVWVKAASETGEPLTGLPTTAFVLAGGTDPSVKGLRELAPGLYWLAVPADLADNSYQLQVDADGFLATAARDTGALTSSVTDLTANPFTASYAYRVASVTDETGAAVTGATVHAGNGLSTLCVESGGSYGCPVPLADTALDVNVAKDGFVTSQDVRFSKDRTDAADPQRTVAVSGLQYTYKVTAPGESSLDGVLWQKRVGDGPWTTAPPAAVQGNTAFFAQSPREGTVQYEAMAYGATTQAAAFTATSSEQTTAAVTLTGDLAAKVDVDSTILGAPATYLVTFTPRHAWPADGQVQVTFPAGFRFEAPAASLSGADGSLSASRNGQALTFTRTGGTTSPGGARAGLTVTGITNPAQAPTQPVHISLRDHSGHELDAGDATVLVGVMDAPVESAAPRPTAATQTPVIAAPAAADHMPYWWALVPAPFALFLLWLEAPSRIALARRPRAKHGVAWRLRHCPRCQYPLTRGERILRFRHHCQFLVRRPRPAG